MQPDGWLRAYVFIVRRRRRLGELVQVLTLFKLDADVVMHDKNFDKQCEIVRAKALFASCNIYISSYSQ